MGFCLGLRAYQTLNKELDFFKRNKEIIIWNNFQRNFARNCVKSRILFSRNSVKNSLICPKAKSATHCLTKLFPIYQNTHWTIRQQDNHTFVPLSHHIILKIVRWNAQLGPKLRPHVGLSNITTASECLNIIQAQPFVSDLHC